MSPWWWLAIVPVAYALLGWAAAYAEAALTVRARKACHACGRPFSHADRCTCDECTNRTYVCRDHGVEETAVTLAFWPLWVGLMVGAGIARAWWHVDPGKVAEAQAERKRMAVLVRADKEVEDA